MVVVVRLAPGGFGDDFFRRLARHFFVMAERLGVDARAAGQRAQRAGVVIEFRRRHAGLDDLERAFGLDAENFSAPRGQVAHDLAHEGFRHLDFDDLNRLQQQRPGGGERLLERKVTGDLERDVLGIHRVHLAVVKINLHVGHAAAGENALVANLRHAFLDRRHKVAVHVLADERLGELHAAVARPGFDAHPDFGKLARAAGLLLVAVFGIAFAADGFAVFHARRFEVHVDVVPAAQAVGDDF